jgi:hypothetical protein
MLEAQLLLLHVDHFAVMLNPSRKFCGSCLPIKRRRDTVNRKMVKFKEPKVKFWGCGKRNDQQRTSNLEEGD